MNRLCLAAGVTLVESGSAGYLGQVSVIRKVRDASQLRIVSAFMHSHTEDDVGYYQCTGNCILRIGMVAEMSM